MASYQTVFDTAAVPFEYGWTMGLLAVGALTVFWGIRRLLDFNNSMHGYVRAFRSFLVFGAGCVMFYLACSGWWQHRDLQAAMASGEGIEQIEGVVQDHWVKEETRETSNDVKIEVVEHFRISTVEFKFAQGRKTGRYFTNAADHSVKLYDGMRLRVSYVAAKKSNKIVKLEIAQ